MDYWLHRISYHSEVSYDLLKRGYLTIGWKDLSKPEVLEEIKKNSAAFRKLTDSKGLKNSRSRWNLWYFAQMKAGDIVVVPMYNKKFGIYRVLEGIDSIYNLAPLEFLNSNGDRIKLTSDKFINESKSSDIDLGFYLVVEEINITEREYAKSKLISRMKMRQTNGNINDIKDEVEHAMYVKGPKDIKGEIIEALTGTFVKETLFSQYTPAQIEVLVQQYFIKIGASDSNIPAKNDPDKLEGSDADVIATFNDLNIAFYVQVKHHEGETGIDAVKQITSYLEEYNNSEESLVNIPWVLTTAKFSEEAKGYAEENNIRLIEGDEFVRMLLNAGFSNIDII